MLSTFTLATVTGPLAAKLMLQLNYIALVDLLTFTHLPDAFIQSDLQLHSGNTCFLSVCVPWDSNPQPFALLTQCSTTEPHRNTCPRFVAEPRRIGTDPDFIFRRSARPVLY